MLLSPRILFFARGTLVFFATQSLARSPRDCAVSKTRGVFFSRARARGAASTLSNNTLRRERERKKKNGKNALVKKDAGSRERECGPLPFMTLVMAGDFWSDSLSALSTSSAFWQTLKVSASSRNRKFSVGTKPARNKIPSFFLEDAELVFGPDLCRDSLSRIIPRPPTARTHTVQSARVHQTVPSPDV